MYEHFYGLKEKPFSIQPDPDFLFFSLRHSMAYAMLEYGIQNRAGFSVICGEIGCGKTTLVRHLLNNLSDQLQVGIVYNTHKHIDDLLGWIMLAFGQPYEGKSNIALFDAFQQFLIKSYAEDKKVVLIVDEAQNLTADALESLRMLSNINADKDQLLQIILVGQPQLRDLLRKPELAQFFQRVSVDFYIPPLEDFEVEKYINHRLLIAGRDTPLFTSVAIKQIAMTTRGIPRSINILCDTALVYGFSTGADKIDVGLVREVIKDRNDFGVLGS
ncbi:MAG: general secretion pathway protein [Methylophilaceae bacterium 17-44-8]|jgi:type II secretory pathway predicted ATPase ExeA|nr:MAG: general secretion pathway protein [Methylophilales bacterium 28-44-11]OZA06925.1 MAG: general secretion pathway protein [Methylophilaceae bacterium 17-44-8]